MKYKNGDSHAVNEKGSHRSKQELYCLVASFKTLQDTTAHGVVFLRQFKSIAMCFHDVVELISKQCGENFQ